MSAVLVIQTNNVGDLVLATPFLAQLRSRRPDDAIHVLANSYNAPVLDGNWNVDRVHVYTKLKHRKQGECALGVYWHTACLLHELRRSRYDYVFLLPGCDLPQHFRLAKVAAPNQIIACPSAIQCVSRDAQRRSEGPGGGIHPVRHSLHLLDHAFPSEPRRSETPTAFPCQVFPTVDLKSRRLLELESRGLDRRRLLVALQISARRFRQRWPASKFARLARRLTSELDANALLLWSPGPIDAATHPGDDAKAGAVLELCTDFTIFPCATRTLSELIAVLSLADIVVSSDGGATHLAAACNRPIVALFGDANPVLWHPWCAEYRIVQAGTHACVEDIEVEQVFNAVVAIAKHSRVTDRRRRTIPATNPFVA